MFLPNPAQFPVNQLVPKVKIAKFGNNATYLLCPLLMISLQQLRNRFGRIVCLNETRQQSSIRTSAFYSSLQAYADSDSMHKYGKALDLLPLDTTVAEIHAYLKAHPDEFPFIHFVEDVSGWLHIDVRNQPNMTFWRPAGNGKGSATTGVYKQKPIDWSLIAPGI